MSGGDERLASEAADPLARGQRTRARYRVWSAVVIAVAVLPPASFMLATTHTRAADLLAGSVLTCVAVTIAGLIVTTPPDAIRLRPRRSVALIGSLTSWLLIADWFYFERTPVAAGSAILVAVASLPLGRAFARLGTTPWWAAVLLWNPAVLGPVAVPLPWVAIVGSLLAGVLWMTARNRPPLASR